jgi:hypothetical protein
MKHVKMLVTPETAELYLAKKSSYQRAVSDKTVKRYAEAMRRGEWMSTPTHCIGISPDGFVVDGQHRLSAVVQSGCSIEMWVLKDAPVNTFSVIDQGRNRDTSQIAKMKGLKNNTNYAIAAINTLVWQPGDSASFAHQNGMNKADVLALLEYYSDELDLVFPAGFSGQSQLRTGAFRGAMLRILISKPELEDYVSDFIRIVANGFSPEERLTTMDSDMPCRLRNYLQKRKQSLDRERQQAFWATFKAFDHAKSGTKANSNKSIAVFGSTWPTKHRYPINLDSRPPEMTVAEWVRNGGDL